MRASGAHAKDPCRAFPFQCKTQVSQITRPPSRFLGSAFCLRLGTKETIGHHPASRSHSASSMAHEKQLELVRSLAKPSPAHDEATRRSCFQLVESAKAVMQSGVASLIDDAQGGVCMQFSSADGTPLKLSQRTSLQVGRTKCKTGGKAGIELLAAIEFTRTQTASDSIATRLAFRDPVPLVRGKDQFALVAAMRCQWRTLRERGFRGLALQGYCFDRQSIEAITRLLAQFQALLQPTFGVDAADSARLAHTEIQVVLACAVHDGHNALKWSLPSAFNDADLLRDVFIASAALRSSFDIFHRCLAQWVAGHIRPGEAWDGATRARWTLVWELLGVKPGLRAGLLKWELRFDDASGALVYTESVGHIVAVVGASS